MNGLYLTVVFFLGSTYSCVAIAVERYLGICFSQSTWNVRKSRYYVVLKNYSSKKTVLIINGLYLTVVFFLGSTYSCVAIAVERYLGICFSQSSWNVRKSRYYVVAICMTTIIIDGPRYYTRVHYS